MKITLEKYNFNWVSDFEKVNLELEKLLGFLNPRIEHIGSTSIEGLSAKPIIDVMIGLDNENTLDNTIKPLISEGYVYYEKYNKDMPYRRFFVKHKSIYHNLEIPNIIKESDSIQITTEEHINRLAHIHILIYNSEHWIRHIAFRDYLRTHIEVREEYQKLKEQLCCKEWIDGNDYNKAKDAFIKTEQANAIRWYQK